MGFENIIAELKKQIAKAEVAGQSYLVEHTRLTEELNGLATKIQDCAAEIERAQAAIDRLEGKPSISRSVDVPANALQQNPPAEDGFEWVDGVLRPVGWGSMVPVAQAIENQRPAFILPPVVEDASFGDPVSLF